jgi:hypothetical protein
MPVTAELEMQLLRASREYVRGENGRRPATEKDKSLKL